MSFRTHRKSLIIMIKILHQDDRVRKLCKAYNKKMYPNDYKQPDTESQTMLYPELLGVASKVHLVFFTGFIIIQSHPSYGLSLINHYVRCSCVIQSLSHIVSTNFPVVPWAIFSSTTKHHSFSGWFKGGVDPMVWSSCLSFSFERHVKWRVRPTSASLSIYG